MARAFKSVDSFKKEKLHILVQCLELGDNSIHLPFINWIRDGKLTFCQTLFIDETQTEFSYLDSSLV